MGTLQREQIYKICSDSNQMFLEHKAQKQCIKYFLQNNTFEVVKEVSPKILQQYII